ncbi:hypothetical protein J2X63_002856 [Agromyces sp. 3263]|nr:hypothetical protein [Agromyces sp. 3263]
MTGATSSAASTDADDTFERAAETKALKVILTA